MASSEGEAAPPLPRHLIAIIRSLVESTNLVLLDHARERMDQRGIDMLDVLRVLRLGDIVGPIEAGRNDNEWKCKLVHTPRYPDDKREIGVVTVVVAQQQLLIKTVEYELK